MIYNPSYLRSIWQTDPVTITPWQYLKQRKISNNKITISSPRPPCVPPVTMVYVQADTQTALILLHILSPAIPGGQRHFTPVKIIAENFIWNNVKRKLSTYVQVNWVWGLDWWRPIQTAPEMFFCFRYSRKYSAESSEHRQNGDWMILNTV